MDFVKLVKLPKWVKLLTRTHASLTLQRWLCYSMVGKLVVEVAYDLVQYNSVCPEDLTSNIE